MQKDKREKLDRATWDELKELVSAIVCPCVKKTKHGKANPKCRVCDGTGKPKIKPLLKLLNTLCY